MASRAALRAPASAGPEPASGLNWASDGTFGPWVPASAGMTGCGAERERWACGGCSTRAGPHKRRQVRIGRGHGAAIPDCPNCPSAAERARRSGGSADCGDGLRHRRHRAYQRIIRRGGAAGDRGDDAFLGNHVDDDNIDDDNDIGDERRVIPFVGQFGEIHCGGERRRVASGGCARCSLQQCTALGDVPAIWGFSDGTVPRRHQSFLRALIEARDHP